MNESIRSGGGVVECEGHEHFEMNIINEELALNVDDVFNLLFTDSPLFSEFTRRRHTSGTSKLASLCAVDRFVLSYKLRPVGSLQLDLAAQRAAAASQPADWYSGLLRTVQPTDPFPEVTHRSKCGPICTHFWKNVIIFVTTTPIHIQESLANAR